MSTEMEQLVRETLAQYESQAPSATGFAERVRSGAAHRARVRRATRVSCVLALGTALGISYLQFGTHPRTQAPTGGATSAAVPSGKFFPEHVMVYGGLSFRVPTDWVCTTSGVPDSPLGDPLGFTGTCALPASNSEFATISAYETLPTISDAKPTVFLQQAATVGTERSDGVTRAVLTLPILHAALEVHSANPAIVDQVLSSGAMELDGGCAVGVGDFTPGAASSVPGTARKLVPGAPIGAVLCPYSIDKLSTHSVALTATVAEKLRQQLNALPVTASAVGPVGHNDAKLGNPVHLAGFIVRFIYADGTPLDVYLYFHQYPGSGVTALLGATNGSSSATFTTDFITQFETHIDPGYGPAQQSR